jgi:hypothetical protein
MRTALLLALATVASGLHAEDNTTLLVDGQTLSPAGALIVGDSGTNNSLVITRGGALTNENGTVGALSGARNNRAIIDGVGSVWTVGGLLTIGQRGQHNSVLVTNGGLLFHLNGELGALSNKVVVSGRGSTWMTAGKLNIGVGADSRGCDMVITDGGYAELAGCVVATDGRGNRLVVTGAGSSLFVRYSLSLAYHGVSNSLAILDGATARCAKLDCALYTSAGRNQILIDGPGSALDVLGPIRFGGKDDGLVVRNGARLTSLSTRLSRTQVRLEGAGSLWQCSQLTMNPGSTNLVLNGAALVVTNGLGTAEIDVISAFLAIRDARVIADTLVLTNSPSPPHKNVRFDSGVFEARQLRFGNTNGFVPAALQVGDGTNAARLLLRGATNSPSHASLIVASNSFLEAAGVVKGFLTNRGVIILSAAAPLECWSHLWSRGTMEFEVAAAPEATLPLFTTRSNASLGGALALRPAASPDRPAHGLRLMQWRTRTGEFANAPDGARVPLGAGTVRVDYAPDGLLVADYREDLDGDGIDDAWARARLGHTPLTAAETGDDPDRDGQSTGAEAVAGTDPLDAASVFKISGVSLDPQGRPVLRFAGAPGKRYRVWRWEPAEGWTEVPSPSFAYPDASEVQWTEPALPPGPARCYRVSVE